MNNLNGAIENSGARYKAKAIARMWEIAGLIIIFAVINLLMWGYFSAPF